MNAIGNLCITSDFDIARSLLLNNGKVIVLDEFFEEDYPGVTLGSTLLPPYSALESLVDSDIQGFAYQYMEYLSSTFPDSFCSLIMLCLLKGINICMYAPQKNDNSFIQFLLDYLRVSYGVVLDFQTNQSVIDLNFLPIICDKLYLYGLISGDEFFQMKPVNTPITPVVLPKLVDEFKPYLPSYSEASYMLYFTSLLQKTKNNNNSPMIIPIKRCD